MLLDTAIGLRTAPGELAVRSSPARLTVRQSPAQLAIQNPGPQLSLRTSRGRLSVDSTRTRAELGYYTYYGLISHAEQKSASAAAAGIARIVSWGETYKRVERDPTAIVTLGTQSEPMPDWQLAHKPLTRPEISYSPGDLRRQIGYSEPRVQVSPRPPIIEIQAVPPRISYAPGSLQVYLRRVEGNLGDLLDLAA